MIMQGHRQTIRDITELGAAVRTGRKAQGLTQQQFADIAGVGVRFLSELERGKETAEVGLVLHVVQLAGFDLVLQQKGVRPQRGND
jgi:y4mF family transcriptional regulator